MKAILPQDRSVKRHQRHAHTLRTDAGNTPFGQLLVPPAEVPIHRRGAPETPVFLRFPQPFEGGNETHFRQTAQ